ncbi:adenosylhomocysteine nucleosidase [Microdochium nivale]|nr:adenosylhomocysteine nucleosidase [Microdochium nivale]
MDDTDPEAAAASSDSIPNQLVQFGAEMNQGEYFEVSWQSPWLALSNYQVEQHNPTQWSFVFDAGNPGLRHLSHMYEVPPPMAFDNFEFRGVEEERQEIQDDCFFPTPSQDPGEISSRSADSGYGTAHDSSTGFHEAEQFVPEASSLNSHFANADFQFLPDIPLFSFSHMEGGTAEHHLHGYDKRSQTIDFYNLYHTDYFKFPEFPVMNEIHNETSAFESSRMQYWMGENPEAIDKIFAIAFANKIMAESKGLNTYQMTSSRLASTLPQLILCFALDACRGTNQPTRLEYQRDIMLQAFKSRNHIVQLLIDLCEVKEDISDMAQQEKAFVRSDLKSKDYLMDWINEHDSEEREAQKEHEGSGSHTEQTFTDHSRALDEHQAYEWLISKIDRDISSNSSAPDELSAIHKIIIEALAAQVMSHKYVRYRPVAMLKVKWDPLQVFKGEEYGDKPHVNFRDVIVLTGDFMDAQAMTCGGYMLSMWPYTSPAVLTCLERLLEKDSHQVELGTDPMFFGSILTMHRHCRAINAHVLGSVILIGEVCEQLAWLGSVFRSDDKADSAACCTPFIASCTTSPFFTELAIDFRTTQAIYPLANGSCWHSLFRNPVIARGFPIPVRPPAVKGLELTLGLMATLTQTQYLNHFGPNQHTMLKGFSAMAYPISQHGDTTGWHVLTNEDGSHLSFAKGLGDDPLNINLQTVEQSRHILGWCTDAKSNAGATDALYDIEISGLPLAQESCTLQNALVRRGLLICKGENIESSNKHVLRQLSTGGYTSRLKWLETQRVVLWDASDKRGWLVNGPSALLHMLRAYIHHMSTGIYQENFLLANSGLVGRGPCHTPKTAIQVLLNPEYRRMSLFVDDDETLQDKIEHFYNILDQLISYQDFYSGSSGMLNPRDQLEGWDLADFAASEDPIRPRVARIPDIGRSWIDFIRTLKAPVLFGQGFGDIIQPSPSCEIGPAWARVPVDSYLLTSLFCDLPRCEISRNRTGKSLLQFSDNAIWHGPGVSPAVDQGGLPGRAGASTFIQVLLPREASNEHHVLLLPETKRPQHQPALIFGHNPAFSWSWGEYGPPVLGKVPPPSEPSSDLQQVRSDSGFWSGSLSSEASSPSSQVKNKPAIGILCALHIELKAVRSLFERSYTDPVVEGDDSCYVSGHFGGYDVVASCIGYGPTRASNAFANLTRSFPKLEFCLMIGIGGGIPSEKNDIRLGDVVVGTPSGNGSGVVQYNAGKACNGSIEETRLHFVQPPRSLIAVINRLRSAPTSPQTPLDVDITRIVEQNPASCHPGEAKDTLYQANPIPELCGISPTCCQIQQRPDRPSTSPVIHYGTIASGSLVIKDAALRDSIGKRFGALCVEMEAAGLEGQMPCLVVRGICDYADGHKNKAWQEYAAASAAAYAKYLLEESGRPGSPAYSSKKRRLEEDL